MLGTVDLGDTWLDFVVEMRPHLRDLRAGLRDARDAAAQGQLQSWAQASHLVKGAAALVGLSGLSHAAYYQEEALRAAASGERPWSAALRAGLQANVERLEEYLFALVEEQPLDDEAFLEERRAAFAALDHAVDSAEPAVPVEAPVSAADRAYAAGARMEPAFRWAEASLEEHLREPRDAGARRGLAGAFSALAEAAGASGDEWSAGLCRSLADMWHEAVPAEADPQWLAAAALDALEHRLFGARDAGLEDALDVALATRFMPAPNAALHDTAGWELPQSSALPAMASPIDADQAVPASVEAFEFAPTPDTAAAPASDELLVAPEPSMPEGDASPAEIALEQDGQTPQTPADTAPAAELPNAEMAAPSAEPSEWDGLDPELRDLWIEEAASRCDRQHAALARLAADFGAEELLAAAAGFDDFGAAARGAGLPETGGLAARLADAALAACSRPGNWSAEFVAALRSGLDVLQDAAFGTLHPDDYRARAFAALAALEGEPQAAEPASAEAVEPSPPLAETPSLADTFAAEARTLAARMRAGLGQALGDDRALRDLRDAAHTLKGAAGAVGATWRSAIAADIETLLDGVVEAGRAFGAAEASAIAEGVELIERLSAGADAAGAAAAWQARFAALPEQAPAVAVAMFEALAAETLAAAAAPEFVILAVETPAAESFDATQALESAPELRNAGAAEPPSAAEPDERAEISPELLDVFTEEAEDHVRQLRNGLAALERNADDRDTLQDVRRSAHTLKGAAGAVGLRSVAKLAHRMEDVLDQLYEGLRVADAPTIALLHDSTDLLEDLATGARAAPDRRDAVYARFAALLGAAPGAAEPAAADAPLPATAVPGPDATQEFALSAPSDAANDAALNGPTVRVPLARLDELVRLVSELVINRAALEQRVSGYARLVNELRTSGGRVRHSAAELQVAFEAKTLGGQGLPELRGRAPAGNGGRGLWAAAGGDGGGEFDELEFDRYTQFHLVTRALAESATDVNTVGGELRGLLGEFDALITRQARLSRDLQNRLTRVRMVPLANLAPRLRRATRQVAQQLGKLVDLEFSGAHTELDKTVLEEMADPLLHLLRNCVDHGAEPPEERRAEGKPERARVFVRAFHRGTQALIQVGDDGRGLGLDKLRAAAVRGGLLPADRAAAAAPEELHALIFAPGFSTAAAVSEVSGRGVGMDIVRDKVRRLKGTVHVESRPGLGTTFTIALPMSLAVVRALLVQAGGRMYAVPMQAVSRILRVDPKSVQEIGGARAIDDKGTLFPLRRLADALGLPAAETAPGERAGQPSALLVRTLDRDVAVEVERVLYGREVVVKSLGTHLRRVPGVMGATILGDGSVVPILDAVELFGPRDAALRSAPRRPERGASRGPLELMVVDDSVSVRRVVCNLAKSRGWKPLQARDGLDALEQLRAGAAPDVMLLDVEMPRMTGYDLLAQLRGDPQFARLPVAMVTSRAGAKHRRKALDLGADEYVVKPYQDDDLVALVERLAAGGRQAADPRAAPREALAAT